ncbi:MAG: hypothetical protein HYY10_02575 [Candidatus Liptonbacteria bacterium]|nr:hypothetical protein [Candidatus Liptonbacteria bacterium]
MINEKIGVSKSTLSDWFRDKPFTPNQEVLQRIQYGPIKSGALKHNKKVEEVRKLREEGVREIGALTRRDLWLLGIGLYIGEGSKTHDIIRVINSDPKVIKLMMRWFQEACNVEKGNITVRLFLYPDNDLRECTEYWRKITGLPFASFRKPQIDQRANKSDLNKRKLPYGTAHVTIVCGNDPSKGVRLHRKIMGWIAGALS